MPAPFNPVARLKAWAYMRERRVFTVVDMRETIGMSQKTAWKLMRVYAIARLIEVAEDGRQQKPDVYRVISDGPLPLEILNAPLDACVIANAIVKRQLNPRVPKPPRVRKVREPKMPKPTPKVSNPGMGYWLKMDGTRHQPIFKLDCKIAKCKCHEATVYRTLGAPTLKGWRWDGEQWLCPRCAEAA